MLNVTLTKLFALEVRLSERKVRLRSLDFPPETRYSKGMKNETALMNAKNDEAALSSLIRVLTATGASEKRLAALRTKLEAIRSGIDCLA